MTELAVLDLVIMIPLSFLLSALATANTPDGTPQFYFTRLAYTEDGSRGFGRSVGPNYRCPEFGGGNFFPPQGTGWSMDSPGADCKFMGGVHRLTGLSVYPNPNMIEVLDEQLFNFPYSFSHEK